MSTPSTPPPSSMNQHPLDLALRNSLVVSQTGSGGAASAMSQWHKYLERARSSNEVASRWAAMGAVFRQHLGELRDEVRSSASGDDVSTNTVIEKLARQDPLAEIFRFSGVELQTDEAARRIEEALRHFDEWTLSCIGAHLDSERTGRTWSSLQAWTVQVIVQLKVAGGLRDRLARSSAMVPAWVATSRRPLWNLRASIPSSLKVTAEQLAALSLDWMFAVMRTRHESGIAPRAADSERTEAMDARSWLAREAGFPKLSRMKESFLFAASKANEQLSAPRHYFQSEDGSVCVLLTHAGPELLRKQMVKLAVLEGELPAGTKFAWRTLEFDLGTKAHASREATHRAAMDTDNRLFVEYPDGRVEFWMPKGEPE